MNLIETNEEWKVYVHANRMTVLYHLPASILDYLIEMEIVAASNNRIPSVPGKLVREYRIETKGNGKHIDFVLFRIYQTNGEFELTPWLINGTYDRLKGVRSDSYIKRFDLPENTNEEEVKQVMMSFFLPFEWDERIKS